MIRYPEVADEGDAEPFDRRLDHQAVIVEDQPARHIQRHLLATPLEFPSIQFAAGHATANAFMRQQIRRRSRHRCAIEIGRRANHNKAGIRTAGYRDHVLRNGLRQPDAGVKTLRNDVDGASLHSQFDLHIRIAPEIFRDDRPQDLMRGALLGVDTQHSGRRVAKRVDIFHRAFDLNACAGPD